MISIAPMNIIAQISVITPMRIIAAMSFIAP